MGDTDLSGNAPLQKVDCAYNIRGWLTQINNPESLIQPGVPGDLFAFRIGYDTPASTQGAVGAPLFNGNISETHWKTGSDNVLRSYGYGYDALNRLRQAVYHKQGMQTGSYNEEMSYDKNGNITSMVRTGDLDAQSVSIEIDDLAYAYHPQKKNQLVKVTDASIHPSGFLDGADTQEEYGYDGNGNMVRDDNKDISLVRYNHLDLPVEISFSGTPTRKINYLYRADGTKAGKTVENGTETAVTEYLSGFQYRGGTIDFFPTAEGYVRNINLDAGLPGTISPNFVYVFNYADHLGNIRLSYSRGKNGIPSILEENHYYPFGLKHEKYGEDQYYHVPVAGTGGYNTGGVEIQEMPAGMRRSYQYKYNGKEFQDELGLNLYDFGARNYDPALGRWMNIDPLAETSRRFSPYTYALNNPVYFIDPDGMEAEEFGEASDSSSLEGEGPTDPPKPGEGTATGSLEYINANGSPSGVPREINLDEVVIEVTMGHISNDGISVYGVGGETLEHSGDGSERSSGGVDADRGDMGTAFDLGQLIGGILENSPAAVFVRSSYAVLTTPGATNATAGTVPAPSPETVTVQRYDYISTDAFRGSPARPHAGYPRDTSVVKGNESVVNLLNTKDSLRAAKESSIKNAEYKKNRGW